MDFARIRFQLVKKVAAALLHGCRAPPNFVYGAQRQVQSRHPLFVHQIHMACAAWHTMANKSLIHMHLLKEHAQLIAYGGMGSLEFAVVSAHAVTSRKSPAVHPRLGHITMTVAQDWSDTA